MKLSASHIFTTSHIFSIYRHNIDSSEFIHVQHIILYKVFKATLEFIKPKYLLQKLQTRVGFFVI